MIHVGKAYVMVGGWWAKRDGDGDATEGMPCISVCPIRKNGNLGFRSIVYFSKN